MKKPVKKKKRKEKSKLRGWIEDIIFVAVAVFLIRTWVIHAFRIPTGSMENTLLVGDFLFANKFIYGLKIPFTYKRGFAIRDPKRSDVVIFRAPYEKRNLVKRCMGVEGDTIEIKNKVVYINGKRLDEPYAQHIDPNIYPPLTLGVNDYQRDWERGRFFRMGGHVRDNFGPVLVPRDHLFMMGDNRDNSFDSRFWGPLHEKYVIGEAMVLYFSWNNKVPWYKIWAKVRWKRIGHIIR
jgi:signal peptidase I